MHLGKYLIIFSLLTSIVSLICLGINIREKKSTFDWAKRLFYISGISIIFAVILLFIAFLSHSFQLSYVYNYSSLSLSTTYLITAFWAGQEGTFLLWLFLLYIFGYIILREKDENANILLAVISITQIFILIILIAYSPFRLIWEEGARHFRPGMIPQDGSGLNPLLQNPWMVIHPPVLFVGYASAIIPFAYAIVGLLKKDYTTWIDKSYKWILFCVTTLGIGIFLGAYWAYLVLGWGGYWGWDPVENSSLIPWIFIVALMHGVIIQKRKNALIKTNILLSIITFILIFYSTFLTRSGVLSDFSVHSFSDLGLSGYLIFIICFFILTSAFLFIKQFQNIESNPMSKKILTFDNIISYGIITLICYGVFILIGTSMPILSKLFLPKPTTVFEGFYNIISIPMGILILALIGLVAAYKFPKNINKKTIISIIVPSIFLGVLYNLSQSEKYNSSFYHIFAYVFTILALFIIVQSIYHLIKYKIKNIAPYMAHIGVAVLVIGIIASNIHSYSVQKRLHQGKEETIDTINITFKGITRSMKSTLKYSFNDGSGIKDIDTLYYTNRKTKSLYREPYISYGFFRDIYISPIKYQRGIDNRSSLTLTKGEEKKFDNYKIKFVGFDIDKKHMKSGTPKLMTKLNIKIKGKNYTISPGIIIKGKDSRESIDAKLPITGQRVSLLNFDLRSKKIFLFIESGNNAPTPPDSALIEMSFKKLIWLVWLGTILISAGGFLAISRKS